MTISRRTLLRIGGLTALCAASPVQARATRERILTDGPDVGMPAVNTCMGCHTIVAAAKPEIQKLAKYAANKRPIPWVRIHKVPEYVHFPHVRHVNAGVTCQSCHGQVQKMAQVYQYASLNMGWCINCHVNGYDPKEGQKAAGYDSVPPAGYSGGAP